MRDINRITAFFITTHHHHYHHRYHQYRGFIAITAIMAANILFRLLVKICYLYHI